MFPISLIPGDHVTALVTDVGIFEKPEGKDTFVLTSYIPYGTAIREEEAIKGIKRLVGWELEVCPALEEDRPALVRGEDDGQALRPAGFLYQAVRS